MDDDDETVFPLVLRRTADVLADRLEQRLRVLRQDTVTTDEVIAEIRRHIAAGALDDPIGVGDLAELLVELITTKENTHRAV